MHELASRQNLSCLSALKTAKSWGAVAGGAGVGGMDSAVESTWMHSRRPNRQATAPCDAIFMGWGDCKACMNLGVAGMFYA